MTDPTMRLADAADALRSAAQRLHDDAVDPACAQLVPAALDAMEDALTTLSRSCYAAAHSFVPLGDSDKSIAERFARAAGHAAATMEPVEGPLMPRARRAPA
jgi:hypothetical protein